MGDPCRPSTRSGQAQPPVQAHRPDVGAGRQAGIDFFDIDPFLLALFDEAAYAAAFPDCWRITADINRDGGVDFFDIDPFLACLFGACP